MRGFLTHLQMTLLLNLRNKQAMAFGYVVPIFFLIAITALYRTTPPVYAEFAQIITITALGGACFGMPVSLVSDRERGVLRRFRLAPISPLMPILSTVICRYVIVLTCALIQLAIACFAYGMPMPKNPWELLGAFTLVSFSFMGMGLVIASIARTSLAVQFLGQIIFLPMIIIGGVGVKMHLLPKWAKYVASFLPGRYAVELQHAAVMKDTGASELWFHMAALAVIGLAGGLAGWKMFRWEPDQRLPKSAKWWVMLAVGAWAFVGCAAIYLKKM